MRPKVIIHNSISLDGKFDGYPFDLGIHYGIAMGFKPDALLVGSTTMKNAIPDVPPESPSDLEPHVFDPEDERPYWVIVDSKGILRDVLHFYRKMEYIKEIIVLVSEGTQESYIEFLKEHGYPIVATRGERVDLEAALSELRKGFGIETLVVDSGGTLVSIMIANGLVDEISLVVAPVLIGPDHPSLFDSLDLVMGEGGKKVNAENESEEGQGEMKEKKNEEMKEEGGTIEGKDENMERNGISLTLQSCTAIDKDHVHLLYSIAENSE